MTDDRTDPPSRPLETVRSRQAAPVTAQRLIGNRYRLQRRIGGGGFGQIWLAMDEVLQRPVVVKFVEFDDDAQVDAIIRHGPVEVLLRHPAIVAVLDRGRDGRTLWTVMEHIEGRTFVDLIAELHWRSTVSYRPTRNMQPTPRRDDPQPSPPPDATPEARLTALEEALELLVAAASAVGVAHDRHIVHRDLKPDNLMYEAVHGRRLPRVIDWDLALVLPGEDDGAEPTPRSDVTSVGVPDFLAPERILGHGDDDRAADVFSLGAILYSMLTGKWLRGGVDLSEARSRLRDAPAPEAEFPPTIAELGPEWVAVCRLALDPEPTRRPQSASRFADMLQTAIWRGRLRRSRSFARAADRDAREARRLRAEAGRMLSKIRPWENAVSRLPAWQIEDQARRLEDEAEQFRARSLAAVHAVLRARPLLPEALILTAEDAAERLREAERRGDELGQTRHLVALRNACAAVESGLDRDDLDAGMPEFDPTADPTVPDRLARCRQLIDGRARLTLDTGATPVEVHYAPIHREARRWVAGAYKTIGTTPLTNVDIPHGRALLQLVPAGDGEPAVVYPLHVLRGQHWHGRPPGADEPAPVHIPPPGALGDDDVYVPPGWARIGGDARAIFPVSLRRVWLDGYVIRRHPVTHRDYVRFLNDLVDRGLEDEALRHAPRQPASDDRSRIFTYARADDGRYEMGDVHPDSPVCLISWHSAHRYAVWYGDRTGRPWRLPSEWEYEKAARGADGRRLPWGDHMEAFRSRLAHSQPTPATPAPVTDPTDDISPYGVRWLAGNMRTWCLDAWSVDGPEAESKVDIHRPRTTGPQPLRVMRGAFWASPPESTSAASRFADPAESCLVTCGVRLVYGCPFGWDPETRVPITEHNHGGSTSGDPTG